MMADGPAVPEGSTRGRRTPTFTVESVPAGLLGKHHTTVWAELVVLSGSVKFVQDTPRRDVLATPANTAVIVPNYYHHIEPSADAEFYVQFYV